MRRILIQCGDNLENSVRVLSLATLLRDHGLQPVVGVYTSIYAGLFRSEGLEAVDLYRFRNALPRQDLAYSFDFALDELELLPFERSRSRQSGGPGGPSAEEVAKALRALVAADRAIAETGVDGIVVWNGFTGAFANALRLLKRIRGAGGGFIERGLLRGGTIFDVAGANGASSMSAGVTAAEDARLGEVVARHAAALDWYFPQLRPGTFGQAVREKPRRAILVPLQVQNDTNIVLYSPAAPTMRRLVLAAIRIRDRHFPGHRVVVRPHPEERPGELLNLPMTDGVDLSPADQTLAAALAEADVVVTANSTVGLEAAMAGCLTVALGEGIYCREPFVARLDAGGELSGPGPEEWRSEPERMRDMIVRYLSLVLDRHQVQPFGRRLSIPSGLLMTFGASRAGSEAPPSPMARVRTLVDGRPDPLRVDVVGMEQARATLNYRRPDAPLDREAIQSMLDALFPRRSFTVTARVVPDAGDIAIVGPSVPGRLCTGYAVVLDHMFGLHADAARAREA